MKSKLKVFGVVAFAIALCFALVGCGGGDKADPKKAVIGTWELSELTGASEDDMAMMKAFGLTIEATFAEDGTFKLGMFGETMDGTWDAKSADKVSLTIEGDSVDATIKDGVLSIEVAGEGMKFKKTSDEVKDLGSSSSSSTSSGATSGSSATDDQAIQAIDKEIYSDDNISVMVVDKKQDWLDSCGYTLVITNKSADTAIDFSGSYGTWMVNGKMISPYIYETIQPNAYAETFMTFMDDSIKSIDDLVNVQGSFEVTNSKTYDEIVTFQVTMP